LDVAAFAGEYLDVGELGRVTEMILQHAAADLGGESFADHLRVIGFKNVAFVGLEAGAGGVVSADGAEVGAAPKGGDGAIHDFHERAERAVALPFRFNEVDG